MKTCETCKWWEELGIHHGKKYGQCSNGKVLDMLGVLSEEALLPDFDFGCICHEERPNTHSDTTFNGNGTEKPYGAFEGMEGR